MVLVRYEEVERREAGLNGQDIGRGARETVGGPPLDLMLVGSELPHHVSSGLESIRTVAEDGEQEEEGQMVAEERR